MFWTVFPSIIRSRRLHTASGTCRTGSVAACKQAATEPGGKGGRCVGLSALPPPRADCLKI